MTAGNIVVEAFRDGSQVEHEWEELADHLGAGPFLRPGWVASWMQAFGVGTPLILVARRQNRVVGVLPLESHRHRLVSPANAHTPEAGPLAADTDVALALVQRALRESAVILSIGPLPASSEALRIARHSAESAGYGCVALQVSRSPFIRGAHVRGFQAAARRNLRHDVERRLRRLCEEGAVSIEVHDGRERLADVLEEGFSVEHAGWKGSSGTAIVAQPETARFYRDLAHWAASRGWLRLVFLRIDGRAIAFQFDLEALGVYYSLKIGYDPEYERFSPGKLLMYAMVSRAMTLRLESYELLGTDEQWKHRWADGFHDMATLHAFSGSPVGRLSRAAFLWRGTLARQFPRAARLISSGRAR